MAAKNQKTKNIYFFGQGKADGNGAMKELLGGKGAGLAEMTNAGIPVPPGFTITTTVCKAFYTQAGKLPVGVEKGVKESITRLEKITGKKFGGVSNHLLVSIRSGSKISNSVLFPKVWIDSSTSVKNAIIGESSILGRWVKIEDGCILGDHVIVNDDVTLASVKVCPSKEVESSIVNPSTIM